jgi:hypothetical protein
MHASPLQHQHMHGCMGMPRPDCTTAGHPLSPAGVADAAAQQVALQIQTIVGPNIALSAAIKAKPFAPALAQQFPVLARDVLRKVGHLKRESTAWHTQRCTLQMPRAGVCTSAPLARCVLDYSLRGR